MNDKKGRETWMRLKPGETERRKETALLDEDIYIFGENSAIQQTICIHLYSWMLDESWNSCYSEGRE